jgi:hypothetical protein
MRKLGNLFELAERQLIKENRPYKLINIIEYAVLIRKWLDLNPERIKQVMQLTEEELKRNNRDSRHRYYLKYHK